jgi:hypothetical protein
VLTVAATAAVPAGAATGAAAPAPRYDHIFVIVEENHGFADVIGNPAAPNLNALAQRFGLATQYFGVSHPSEPNYVGLLGGNTFGVSSDDPYFINRVNQPSLVTQLDQAGIGWKAYLQALPHPGYTGWCYPVKCNGAPDNDPLYVSKHDAIQNFTPDLNPSDWNRQVPIEQLRDDLGSGSLPRFGYVIPDECHDQHGDPPYCLDGGNPFDPQDQHLVALGDHYLGQLVSSITNASFWSRGNNAVAIIYDEGDDNAGCCDAGNSDPNGTGGGQVASIVVTSHGPRAFQDATPYNHFSLLQTIQGSFGLGCLAFTCDTANVTPMTPLFTVTGSAAVATNTLPVPDFPTPTPTVTEPVTYTTLTPRSGGWSVVPSPLLGTNDNSLGAVAASSPNDIWAVGNFLPDTANSNQDATLSLANHFDGTRWSPVPVPNAGPNWNTLYGVAASDGRAWAVGVKQNSQFQDRALVDAWDGTKWSVVDVPQPGSQRDLLYGASASSTSDVWAVGHQVGANGLFETLAEHFDGSTWTVVPTPNPGSAGNYLFGVTAMGPDDAWAVGQQLGQSGPDQALIEHWNGERWSVTPTPGHGSASAFLNAIAGSGDDVWAAGETYDAVAGARPLIEHFAGGAWHDVAVPARAGTIWTELWALAVSAGQVWAGGVFTNLTTDNTQNLILRGDASGFNVVNAPNPGSGAQVLGGIAATGDTLWAVGLYDDGGNRLTMIMKHQES